MKTSLAKFRKSGRNGRRPTTRGAGNAPSYPLSRFPSHYADQPVLKLAKLQYTQFEGLPNIGAGAIYERQFRANDLYDPDYAVGGHQPYGFDQLIAQYYHFTVLYSKCEFEVMDPTEARNAQYRIWITQAPGQLASTFALSGLNGLLEERPHSESVAIVTGGNKEGSRKVSMFFDGPKRFGMSAAAMVGDSRFQGDAATSPTEDAYFAIGGFHPGGSAVSYGDAVCRIELTYWAVFTEPKRMVSS